VWIALTHTVAPGLEDAFRRFVRSRGAELGELGRRYGLRQMRVFQRGTHAVMALEVDDSARFASLGRDPDFQMLGQEMAGLMSGPPFEADRFFPEVFAWHAADDAVETGVSIG
jgi:hypothetical protein